MKVFDCFIFYNELELLELRLSILDKYVDYYVLVESTKTFTGISKELVFEKNKERFSKYLNKIIHVVVDDLPLEKGAWETEFHSRNSILDGLKKADENDLIIISDVDEIPNPDILQNYEIEEPRTLSQKLYYYFLNCRQKQMWNGSVISKKKHLTTPQKFRDKRNEFPRIANGGWHFSFIGGAARIIEKIKAYSETQTCTDKTTSIEYITEKILKGEDIFERNEVYAKKKFVEIDDTYPDEIKSFIEKYPETYLELPSSAKQEHKPLFSIIIPTYNQAEFLPEAIESVLNQTCSDWEAVVVNDGSTDNTHEVMENYSFNDCRIRSYHKKNGGTASALNYAISKARGEWIVWISSDDFCEPNRLQIAHDEMKNHPDCKFFHSHWYLFLEDTKTKVSPGVWLQIPPTDFQVTRFFWANYVNAISTVIHRSVFDEVGLFDDSAKQGQDFDMWLRISAKFQSRFIDERTCVTRVHKNQTTNTFVEGGVLDSTRSLIKFLNEKPFEALFPFTDFGDSKNVLMALNEVVYISTKKNAFLYRCGFTSALVERTLEWLSNRVQPNIRNKAYEFLESLIKDYLAKPLDKEVKNVLRSFLNRKKVFYLKHDFFKDTSEYVNYLIEIGDQKQAIAIETYLLKIHQLFNELYNDKRTYEPLILGYHIEENITRLDPREIRKWYVQPSDVVANSIRQTLQINCTQCKNDFNIYIEYEMTEEVFETRFICPKCKKANEFTDEYFAEDFVAYHKNKISESHHAVVREPNIAFFIKDASAVGGGTKVLFKHIEWLFELGAKITVYSYSSKPDWVKLKCNFVTIKSEEEIESSKLNLLVVFSIFDVPLMLNAVPISKLVHLCQGYEGYHFGKTFEELRSDKHILTMLHSVPVRNISVSTHLLGLFKEKFNRVSEYIPNSINHNIFKFSEYETENQNSILFIGNPFHPLKGFEFLASTIKGIQKSNSKIENLKLYIVMGFKYENIEQIHQELVDELNCEVEIKEKQSSEKVAELLRKSSVVVCTSWYEGFSLPLLEAMASGIPVITTENMGAQSFCTHEKNSFIIEYGDMQNLAYYLLRIFNSTINLKAILRNAYRTSLEYSESYSVNSLINTYQNLLSFNFENRKIELLLNKFASTVNLLEKEIDAASIQKNMTVVIPVFNNVEYTKMCVESLQKATPQLSELIIIDNASTDATGVYLSKLAEEDQRVKIIRNEINLGFPKAVNQGLKKCESEFVVIANNDIIFTENWAGRLINVADSNEKIGIVGPVSNEVSGVQIDKNAKYDSIEEMHTYAAELRQSKKNKCFEFPRVAFLCTLIKKEVIDKIGGLDERFSPGNFEDDDFCLRTELAGYKTMIAEDVFIHHFGSKSFKANGVDEYAKRLNHNLQIFLDKWGADPEDIWLKGKSFTNRNPLFPINKDDFVESMQRAMILMDEKDYASALSYLNNAVENYDTSEKTGYENLNQADVLNLAGNTSLMVGDYENAHAYFEKELQLNPTSSRACAGLAEVFFNAEMFEESKTMFEWSLKYDNSNSSSLSGLKKVNSVLQLAEEHNTLESEG